MRHDPLLQADHEDGAKLETLRVVQGHQRHRTVLFVVALGRLAGARLDVDADRLAAGDGEVIVRGAADAVRPTRASSRWRAESGSWFCSRLIRRLRNWAFIGGPVCNCIASTPTGSYCSRSLSVHSATSLPLIFSVKCGPAAIK